MKVKSILIILTLLLTVNTAHAANVWHKSQIKRVYPLADGGFVLTFKVQSPNCGAPDHENYFYVSENQQGVTKEAIQNYLSVALVAATTNKVLNVYFDPDSQHCYVNRMYIMY